MNLGVGRIQNITIDNIFEKEKSIYEFVSSALSKPYYELKPYCKSYYGKDQEKYFHQLTTAINLLGLIGMDAEGRLVENELLMHVYHSDRNEKKYYMNYFLNMWQFPIPSTKVNYGRKKKIRKPYCLLLKLLLELNTIDKKEAYLTNADFYNIFLDDENGDQILENAIDLSFAQEVIDKREYRRSLGVTKDHSSLTYINKLLSESDLLTNNPNEFGNISDYYIGFLYSEKNLEKALYIIETYSSKIFEFDVNLVSSNKKVICNYSLYVNNKEKYQKWRENIIMIEYIDEFKDFCLKEGFVYEKNLIRRFILSLEVKPFVLLTGISGSGKTKIAELWLKFLKVKNTANGLVISVGSNWVDNKKLLGFVNILNESSYQSTELVEFIMKANIDESQYIIILDEMNLSRVEIYFSDFLSALETIDHEITLPNKEKVYWTNNLKIIGTVNIDESTYMFSRKVLDRGNVIEMNGILPTMYFNTVKEIETKVYSKILTKCWLEKYLKILDTLYEIMEGELAFRVIDEITEYLNKNTELYGDEYFETYMDEQLVQKVLTKLHGSKVSLKPKLDRIQDFFDSEPNYVLVNRKIKKMQIDVMKGYASFIGD